MNLANANPSTTGRAPNRAARALAGAVLAACTVLIASRPAAAERGPGALSVLDARTADGVPAPAAVDWPSGAAGLGLGYGTTVLDTFEGALWPDPTRWLYVADLGSGAAGTRWSPSTCLAKLGARSLRANGAAPGGPPACAAAYSGPFTSSAVLALDLSTLGGAASAELAFDLWMDAEPNEGLLVAYLTPGAIDGGYDRHVLYSATGRVKAWVEGGVHIDLANARDVYDAAWRGNLRGKQALLEFVFLSADGSADALGALIDNVAFTARPPVGPTPPPDAVERTTVCAGVRDCGNAAVFAYVDAGCDRRFRRGIDVPLAMQPRIDVVAGPDVLGARLGRSGRLTFQYPLDRSATFTLVMPEGYAMCPDSPNPLVLPSGSFNRYRRATVEFRVMKL